MSSKKRKVFVVHGRNTEINKAMFSFLRSIDLVPLEWGMLRKETGVPSPYIGEILDKAFEIAQTVLVLFTPDDMSLLQKKFWQKNDPPYEHIPYSQARPNVLFEAGMAMGRHSQNTVLVQIGDVKPFSDIAGRHLLYLDNSSEKRQELIARLADTGCALNASGVDWHTTGDFQIEPPDPIESDFRINISASEKALFLLRTLNSKERNQFELKDVELITGWKLDECEYYVNELIKLGLIKSTNDSAKSVFRVSEEGKKKFF